MKDDTTQEKPQVVSQAISQTDVTLKNIIDSQPKEHPRIELVGKKANIFALPKECKKVVNKYQFRWASKDRRMVERAIVKGWLICNRTNSPFLDETMFSVHGGIERFGHLLAFAPLEHVKAMRDKNSQKSRDAVKAMTEEKPKEESFYKAKLSPEKEIPDGLQQGRDF